MLVLVAWFFFAGLLFEISTSLSTMEDGKIVAIFSEQGKERVRGGQAALLRLQPGGDQPELTAPALVSGPDIYGKGGFEIYILDSSIPDELLKGKIKGQVEVEVEHITPAALVLRTSGKYLNKGEIPLSPQEIPNSED
jgi:hypothetical protein